MKLYATVTSERASKSQGGNERVDIELSVGSRDNSRLIAMIHLVADGDDYQLFWDDAERDECPPVRDTLKTGKLIEKPKGKKQKGEDCRTCDGGANRFGNCPDCKQDE